MPNHMIFETEKERWALPNGVRVIAESLPYLSSVSVGVWIHTGSIMESPQEEGLSHFMEHMAFKGTTSRSTLRIAEETDLLGGQLNACTTKDYTCYYNKVISEDLEHALELIGDLVLHPALLAEEMAKERSVICEEIAMDEDDPESHIGELLWRAQYKGTCMEHPILGSPDQINAYNTEDLLRFRAAHYTPDRCVIALCGHYDSAVLHQAVEKTFGSWQGTSPSLSFEPAAPLDAQCVWSERNLEQVHLSLGFPGYAYGDSNNIPMEMLSSILGSSASARLFQRIREELGLAYTVYSYNSPIESTGTFCLYAASSEKYAAQVLDEMEAQLHKLAREGITEQEFTQNQHMLRISFLMGLESPGSRMMSMGHALSILSREYTPASTLQRIENISREEVVELARKLIQHTPSLCVVGKHAEKLAESWNAKVVRAHE
ncbi:MAG: insulinase family protein [Clostridiales bacterium]|nr:insulinase family protein [Clostridiales bacterium]